MPVVSFKARRSLTLGHSAEQTVVLDLKLRDDLTRSRTAVRSDSIAIGGARESVYDRADVTWQGRTQVLYGQDADSMVEFLDSIEDGQIFQWSAYQGSGDSPINYVNVQAEGGYTENREVSTGAPASDGFSYAFRLVVVP